MSQKQESLSLNERIAFFGVIAFILWFFWQIGQAVKEGEADFYRGIGRDSEYGRPGRETEVQQ